MSASGATCPLDLGFTTLSRMNHLYRVRCSSKVDETEVPSENHLTFHKQNFFFLLVTRALFYSTEQNKSKFVFFLSTITNEKENSVSAQKKLKQKTSSIKPNNVVQINDLRKIRCSWSKLWIDIGILDRLKGQISVHGNSRFYKTWLAFHGRMKLTRYKKLKKKKGSL